MNKIITIAAISMFAVIMGFSAVAPSVMAEKKPQVEICHNDDGEDGIRGNADDYWERKFVNGNSVDKHVANHSDVNGVFDFAIVDVGTSDACDALIAADPNPNP